MLNLSTLNPQQRQAVETIRGPVLILAGAGTGKTRVITFRIAHMVERGIAPGNILGVTFTNKAAREMQERVRKLLPRSPKSEVRSQRAARDNRPTICTFHSLCVRILRQHIEKLGYKKKFCHLRRIGTARGGEENSFFHFRQGREDRSRRGAGDVEQIQERRRERQNLRRSKVSARWRSTLPSATNPRCTPATPWTSTI